MHAKNSFVFYSQSAIWASELLLQVCKYIIHKRSVIIMNLTLFKGVELHKDLMINKL